jgi:phospholipase/lecithinase/hemolysin
VGEYFVFNKGDALDWVHPNRDGHRLVAEYLLKNAASCL